MLSINNLELFVLIAERGTLSSAAKEIGISTPAASERLSSLESYLGVKVFKRSTRAISLTEEGRLLLGGAKEIIFRAQELESKIKLSNSSVHGVIKIWVPVELGRGILPIIDDFTRDHHDISIEFIMSDDDVDIISQGVDVVLKYGNLTDSRLYSRLLFETQKICVASPDYKLKTSGKLKTPYDLLAENCIRMRSKEHVESDWTFRIAGQSVKINVNGNTTSNNSEVITNWCLEGKGIAYKPKCDIARYLDSGELIEVLGNYALSNYPLHILHPLSRGQPKRVSVLIEYITQKLKHKCADKMTGVVI